LKREKVGKDVWSQSKEVIEIGEESQSKARVSGSWIQSKRDD